VGGGVTAENAATFLDAGASHVIVTSYVFREGGLDQERLQQLVRGVGVRHLWRACGSLRAGVMTNLNSSTGVADRIKRPARYSMRRQHRNAWLLTRMQLQQRAQRSASGMRECPRRLPCWF
jgi:hypothetical protein